MDLKRLNIKSFCKIPVIKREDKIKKQPKKRWMDIKRTIIQKQTNFS